jgi:hypothetical protein
MPTATPRPRRSLTQIFAIPSLVGIASLGGLVFALVGDGAWDALSWAALAPPVLLFVIYPWRSARR